MRPASFGTEAFATRPRWSRSKTKEKKMRTYSLTELMNLTRAELFALHRQIVDAIAALPEGSPERLTALTTLRYIRRVLARREFAPG
jgi:hypothetical protein